MSTKLKSLLQQLLQSPRRFPVELALGVVFFIIAVWDSAVSYTHLTLPTICSV